MFSHNLSLNLRVVLAILSGLSVVPIAYLEKYNSAVIYGVSLVNSLIGGVFALLVMMPYLKRFNALKVLLLIASSIFIYTLVSELAIKRYDVFFTDISHRTSIILSGGLGAILTLLAVQFIIPIRFKKQAYWMVIVTGAFGGFIFSYSIDSNLVVINSIGYIVWQVLVCMTLYYTKENKEP